MDANDPKTYIDLGMLCDQLGKDEDVPPGTTDYKALPRGGVALVDARYFIDLWHGHHDLVLSRMPSRGTLQSLRNTPDTPENRLEYEPLITELNKDDIRAFDYETGKFQEGNTIILAVSYGWITEDHPDPDGYTLARLASFLEPFLAYRKEMAKDKPDLRVAVFFDWLSMYQKKERPPTDNEKLCFQKAMEVINIWYAHQATQCLAMTDMPLTRENEEITQYDDRGWPNFEQLVSSFSAGATFDLGLLPYDEDNCKNLLYPEALDQPLDRKAVQFSEITKDNMVRVLTRLHGIRRVPEDPEGFNALLQSNKEKTGTTEVEKECRIKITNGKSDRELLKRKYAETFNAMAGSVYWFNFTNHNLNDVDIKKLCRVLPKCLNMEELFLVGNAITKESALKLKGALTGLKNFKKLHLSEKDKSVVSDVFKDCTWVQYTDYTAFQWTAPLRETMREPDKASQAFQKTKAKVVLDKFLRQGGLNFTEETMLRVKSGQYGRPAKVHETIAASSTFNPQAKAQSFSGNLGSYRRSFADSLAEATDRMIAHSGELQKDLAAKDAIIAEQEERIRAQQQRIDDQNFRINTLERRLGAIGRSARRTATNGRRSNREGTATTGRRSSRNETATTGRRSSRNETASTALRYC